MTAIPAMSSSSRALRPEPRPVGRRPALRGGEGLRVPRRPDHHLLGDHMSGHALKHMIAGLGAWRIVTLLRAREPLPEGAPLCVQEIAA